MEKKKIAIVLACSDWRFHRPGVNLNARLIEALDVDAIDLIVLPGPDGLEKPERRTEKDVAVSQLKLLIKAHDPCVLALVGHENCAAHTVSDDAHVADTQTTARALLAASGFAGPMHAMLLTHESDDDWGLKSLAVIS